MEEEKSHIRAIAVVLLVVFLAGLLAGYYIWGYRKMLHPDYKDMLKQTISYITTLEEKNQEQSGRLSTLENEVSALKKQQGSSEDSRMARLNERLAVLEKENADLKSSASQKEALAQENQQLRLRVETLVEQINSSKPARAGGSNPLQLPPPQQAVP